MAINVGRVLKVWSHWERLRDERGCKLESGCRSVKVQSEWLKCGSKCHSRFGRVLNGL